MKRKLTRRRIVKEVQALADENKALRDVLTILVNHYVANQGTKFQFVACVTPNGNMREWDNAMVLLGRELHPDRKMERR